MRIRKLRAENLELRRADGRHPHPEHITDNNASGHDRPLRT
jgi:hypothetical protein